MSYAKAYQASIPSETADRPRLSLVQPPSSPTTITQLTPSRSGVLVLDGFGLTMRVERHHLVLSGGICEDATEARLSKVDGRDLRLVLSGHVNYMTGEALEWLRRVDAVLLVLDRQGKLLFTSAEPNATQPQLRRAQALAPLTGAGLDLTRMLLGRKLRGQAQTLRQQKWPDHMAAAMESAACGIESAAEGLGRTSDIPQLRNIEARAAAMYWDLMEHVPVEWARKDRPRLRDHWRALGTRHSPLTRSPQRAVTPGHALLNYAYALLEAETVIECQAAGLDTSLDVGPLHVDNPYRANLASTVMESARPLVDAMLADFLRKRTFSVSEFREDGEGQVRIKPPLTRELANLLPDLRTAVRPMVQAVVDFLLECSDYETITKLIKPQPAVTRPTTRTRAVVAPAPGVAAAAAIQPIALTQRHCAHCERLTTDTYCSEECAQAAATLTQLGELLDDESKRTPEAWGLLWPCIRRLPLSRMCKATGLSKPWASVTRAGKQVPQSWTWPKLCRA